jgi:hypothetical protein
MADRAHPDSHSVVQERHKSDSSLCLTEVKNALLSGALRAFISAHETKLKRLHIDESELNPVGVNGESPAAFWMHQVPQDCLLSEVSIRVMLAKPSSTAVERLWNVFDDNLTANRRFMKNTTLPTLVYVKVTHHLLDLARSRPATLWRFPGLTVFSSSQTR